jgi:hypothetical protein
MTDQEMVFGRDFTITQSKLKRGFKWHNAKGKHGRGRPRKPDNELKYPRRKKCLKVHLRDKEVR